MSVLMDADEPVPGSGWSLRAVEHRSVEAPDHPARPRGIGTDCGRSGILLDHLDPTRRWVAGHNDHMPPPAHTGHNITGTRSGKGTPHHMPAAFGGTRSVIPVKSDGPTDSLRPGNSQIGTLRAVCAISIDPSLAGRSATIPVGRIEGPGLVAGDRRGRWRGTRCHRQSHSRGRRSVGANVGIAVPRAQSRSANGRTERQSSGEHECGAERAHNARIRLLHGILLVTFAEAFAPRKKNPNHLISRPG